MRRCKRDISRSACLRPSEIQHTAVVLCFEGGPLPKTTSKPNKLWTYSEAPQGLVTDEPHVLNVFRDAYSKGMSKNQIELTLKAEKFQGAYSYIS